AEADAVRVGRDVQADEPQLAPHHPGEGLVEAAAGLAQRLHLAAPQDDPAFHLVEDVVVAPGDPVGRDHAVAALGLLVLPGHGGARLPRCSAWTAPPGWRCWPTPTTNCPTRCAGCWP